MPDQQKRTRSIRRRLLAWYDRNHRHLPWRPAPGEPADPYHALVSEAMLQQTRVATVIDYFDRFIARFPTVDALADADEQAVLSAWQGLGYYRRARNLHRAAQVIVRNGMPDTVEGLRALAGVGRYTAGAIASMAFGISAPVVDGNVKRVLARVERIGRPIDDRAVEKRLWELAERWVPDKRPGDFNQALMELGATVCTPRSPSCVTCPLRSLCRAVEHGDVDRLPMVARRRAARRVEHAVYAVHRNGRYLFEQRGDGGLWAGMWQLVTREQAARRPGAAAWFAEHTGLTIARPTGLGAFTHVTTHRRIRFTVYRASVQSGRSRRGAGRWLKLDELDGLPLSKAQQRAVSLVRAADAPAQR